MSDDKNTKGYRDRSRIDYSQDYERNYWTEKWNISNEQLKEALEKTDSVMVSDVEEYLKKRDYINQ
jgi:hypothetical protein